mgnify:FL=1
MFVAVKGNEPYDVAICVAAVSDWKATPISKEKIKKNKNESLSLKFSENEDILRYLSGSKKRPQLVIGFAAETDNLIDNAKKKLVEKGCDWIIANYVGLENGAMGSIENSISILKAGGIEEFHKRSKVEIGQILAQKITTEIT